MIAFGPLISPWLLMGTIVSPENGGDTKYVDTIHF